MPGKPHLTLTLWQCFPDVGGTDAWMGSWWGETHDGSRSWQWFTGWHHPNPLHQWRYPDPQWRFFGHELWEVDGPAEWKSESYYVEPNPSTALAGPDLTPRGYWHHWYNRQGDVVFSQFHT